jgi:VanZ family protein
MLRIAAWVCVALLAVLSLVPGHAQIRTGAPGIVEHIVAYCATAAVFTLAYPAASRARIILALVCYAGVLEVTQSFVPDRSATVWDFGGSSLGVALGCLIGAAVARARTTTRTQ